MEHKLMPPRYAETIMLDAQSGQAPPLSDVELLATSYLWALEALAATNHNTLIADAAATKALLAETRAQLNEFIKDYCALRDALPRDQVERILSHRLAD